MKINPGNRGDTSIDFISGRGFKILNLGISQKEIEGLEAMIEAPISDMESEDDLEIDELEDSLEGR